MKQSVQDDVRFLDLVTRGKYLTVIASNSINHFTDKYKKLSTTGFIEALIFNIGQLLSYESLCTPDEQDYALISTSAINVIEDMIKALHIDHPKINFIDFISKKLMFYYDEMKNLDNLHDYIAFPIYYCFYISPFTLEKSSYIYTLWQEDNYELKAEFRNFYFAFVCMIKYSNDLYLEYIFNQSTNKL